MKGKSEIQPLATIGDLLAIAKARRDRDGEVARSIENKETNPPPDGCDAWELVKKKKRTPKIS